MLWPPNKDGLTAGLTRETLAALEQAQGRRTSFILVPESSAGSTVATARTATGEPLPQVWQDLFAAARAAQSTEYLDSLATRRPPVTAAAQDARRSAAEAAAAAAAAGSASCSNGGSSAEAYEAFGSAAGGDGGAGAVPEQCGSNPAIDSWPAAEGGPGGDSTLGISQATAFTAYLSPEALVQRHQLGKAEVWRLYQALQVYSLGFHQSMLELTAHAADKGLLLLALWRGFAFLWDEALQVVFPAQTVQQSRERQAALLAGERLVGELAAERARAAALELENAALRQQAEGAVVQMLSVQADAAVARQAAAGLQQQLKAAGAERAAAAAAAEAARREALLLQERLAALAGPQDELYSRAQQLEAALKDKQGQLSAAAKQAAAALGAKEEAQQAERRERLRREAAEARAQQLQDDLNSATLKLRAAASAAASRDKQAAAEAAAAKEREAAEADARAQDTARMATERTGWERQAAAAEAEAGRLQQALAAAEARVEEEKGRNEELVASLWPLTARVKALEAAALAAAAAAAGGATGAVLQAAETKG